MKALTYRGPEQSLALVDLPVPEPGPGQLLLRVRACGICGSDIHAYQAGAVPEHMVFGHEFAGEVAAVGEGVTGWREGDRVAALGALFCGHCEHCLAGEPRDCEQLQLIGFSHPGAYADYVLCQAAASTRLPDGLDFAGGALVEPLAVGLGAFRDACLPLGGNILVVGAGIIGITVVKWARFFGAEHVGISDLDAARLQRAAAAGATVTIDAREHPDAVQAYRERTGVAPDVIVECVGLPLLQHLVETAPREAHIVSVGAAMVPDAIAPHVAAAKKLRVSFSFGYQLSDFEYIIRMIDSGRLATDGLVTRSVSLDEAPDAFDELLAPNSHCKVMIQPA